MHSHLIICFDRFVAGPFYWLMYIIGGIAMLSVALYHQYLLDELPCVLCIHVRLWVVLFILVALAGLLSRKLRSLSILLHVALVLIAVALLERSYQLLGVEHGFIEASCSFDSGLPAWLPVDQWLPWLFGVQASCGYTPEILFGITMAELLLLVSIVMCLIALAALRVALLRKPYAAV